MIEPAAIKPESLAFIGDWLANATDGCTCAGGGEWPHEPHCGLEPIVTRADLAALLSSDVAAEWFKQHAADGAL